MIAIIGEIKVILYNHGNKEFNVNNEDRIAQMVLVPVIKVNFEEVENLPETIRGEGGFGSTGEMKIINKKYLDRYSRPNSS